MTCSICRERKSAQNTYRKGECDEHYEISYCMKILWWQENIKMFKVLKRIVTEDSNEIMMFE